MLPLIPGYLGYVAGLAGADAARAAPRPHLLGVLLLRPGLLLVFVVMSVVLASFGAFAWFRGQEWVHGGAGDPGDGRRRGLAWADSRRSSATARSNAGRRRVCGERPCWA
ncbi:hypothetical protein QJS66_18980 [Kocuria rhizophila]|nr:hypothetical protein QJS66_18980 [Kocuria rhizophila]